MNQKGFTLIETLVALVVLSISIVLILQIFSSNLKIQPSSNMYSRAVIYAKAKMESLLLFEDLSPGMMSGQEEDDIFSWEISITKEKQDQEEDFSDDNEKKENSSSFFELLRVDLRVMWEDRGKEKSYFISTLKHPGK